MTVEKKYHCDMSWVNDAGGVSLCGAEASHRCSSPGDELPFPVIQFVCAEHLYLVEDCTCELIEDWLLRSTEELLARPPKKHLGFFSELNEVIDKPLKPVRLIMNQQDWDDIVKWGKEG